MPARRRGSFVEPGTSRDQPAVRRGSLGGIDCKVVTTNVRRNSADFSFSMDMENLLDGSEFMQSSNLFQQHQQEQQREHHQQQQQPSEDREGRSRRRKSGVSRRRRSCAARVETESPLLQGDQVAGADDAVLEAMQKGIRMAQRSSTAVDDTQESIRLLMKQLADEDFLDDDEEDGHGPTIEDFPMASPMKSDEPSVRSGGSSKKKKKKSKPIKSSDADNIISEDDLASKKSKRRSSVKSAKKSLRKSQDGLHLSRSADDLPGFGQEDAAAAAKTKPRRRRQSFQALSSPPLVGDDFDNNNDQHVDLDFDSALGGASSSSKSSHRRRRSTDGSQRRSSVGRRKSKDSMNMGKFEDDPTASTMTTSSVESASSGSRRKSKRSSFTAPGEQDMKTTLKW